MVVQCLAYCNGLHGLLFSISSQISFICTIPQTGEVEVAVLSHLNNIPLMVRWVIGSILHDRPNELLLIPAWYNKSHGMSHHVCGLVMVHIKDPLLLFEKNSPCSGSTRFPYSLSEWSFTIFPTPYNCK